jgi:riboflavin kinase/FMN adenylyltransferase
LTAQFVFGLDKLRRDAGRGAVVTIGTFDGIHRGHQEIFRRLRLAASESGLEPVLITFDPHPRSVVSPDNAPHLLTSIEEKQRFVPFFFDGLVLVLHFDAAMMNLAAEDFVKDILIDRVGARKVIVGHDHTFGRNRSGNITRLRELGAELGFEVEVVEPVIQDGSPISSSRIRKALTEGSYAEALKLLGHDYAIYGTVERGIGLGRKLGYPTANVKYSPLKLLPREGVYACWARVGAEEKNGMMFIGTNHFNPAGRVTVEANLFDFDRDIYDEGIIVNPTCFVRENRVFPTTKELVRQIGLDKISVMDIITKGETACQ